MQECNCDNCKCEGRYCGYETEDFWGAPCRRKVCNCPYNSDIAECPYWEDEIDDSVCDGCVHNLTDGCDILTKYEQKNVWLEEEACEKYEESL